MPDRQTIESSSLRDHKRQLAWQILIPFLAVTALIIAGAVLVTIGQSSQTRLWADVSIIWMIAPMLVFGLVLVSLMAILIYGMLKLIRILPRFSSRVQGWMSSLSSGTRKVADGTVKPVLWVSQCRAALKAFFRKFRVFTDRK